MKREDADEPAATYLTALVIMTMTTKPTFVAEFKPGEGGTNGGGAGYMAGSISIFFGGRGEKWTWSEIATATVAA